MPLQALKLQKPSQKLLLPQRAHSDLDVTCADRVQLRACSVQETDSLKCTLRTADDLFCGPECGNQKQFCLTAALLKRLYFRMVLSFFFGCRFCGRPDRPSFDISKQ
eukprot:2673093-Amphidinium_carterae.1